jgi:hypothetical protein
MSHNRPGTEGNGRHQLIPFALVDKLVYHPCCSGEGLSAVCPVVRCDSSAPPDGVEWGDAKVNSVLWVLIEDVAAVAVTSGTVSARKVSIRLRAAVIALVAATGSVATVGDSAAIAEVLAVVTVAALAAAVAIADRAAAVSAVVAVVRAAAVAAECPPRSSAKAPAP